MTHGKTAIHTEYKKLFLFWDLGLRFWQKSGRIRENIQRGILRNMCVLCNMTTYYVIMTSHHGCQQILIGVFDFMIKSEIFSNCWILMPGIISTIVDLTHVTWIIVTSIHWLELKQIISNCCQIVTVMVMWWSRDSGLMVTWQMVMWQWGIFVTGKTYFSGFNRSCVQETGHFNLFISDSVGIVVSIVRSTLPVLLTLPALFTNSKKLD